MSIAEIDLVLFLNEKREVRGPWRASMRNCRVGKLSRLQLIMRAPRARVSDKQLILGECKHRSVATHRIAPLALGLLKWQNSAKSHQESERLLIEPVTRPKALELHKTAVVFRARSSTLKVSLESKL